MIRKFFCAAIAVFAVFLYGCNKQSPTMPGKQELAESRMVAERFLDFVVGLDFENAAEYFEDGYPVDTLPYINTSEAKAEFARELTENNPELENYQAEVSELTNAVFDRVLESCKYEITDSSVSEKGCVHNVSITFPSDTDNITDTLSHIMSRHTTDSAIAATYNKLMATGMLNTDSTGTEFLDSLIKDIINKTIEDIKHTQIPTTTISHSLTLTCRDGGWIILSSEKYADKKE